jgi:hypothetical protein
MGIPFGLIGSGDLELELDMRRRTTGVGRLETGAVKDRAGWNPRWTIRLQVETD